MITIKNHIDEILKKEPFILENIKNGLINISALARQIEPELSNKVGKKLNVNAIIMTIKRMEIDQLNKARPLKKQLKKIEVSEIYDWFRDQIKKHGKTLAAMGGGAGIAMMMGAI